MMDQAESREALYQRLIMERARQPRHAGVLDPGAARAAEGEDLVYRAAEGESLIDRAAEGENLIYRAAEGDNPFCGDRVHVSAVLSPGGRIRGARHRTRGCAICAASADLMAESVIDLDEPKVISLFARFDAMLREGPSIAAGDGGDGDDAGLGLLNAFENLHEYRSRIRCATLPWTALLDALQSERTS